MQKDCFSTFSQSYWGAYANTTSEATRTSSENVTSRFCNHFSIIQSQPMLEKCVLNILELNWKQRLRHNKTKLNICHHMLTSSTQLVLQNRSFHVEERTRTSGKCPKMKYAGAKRANLLPFIVKFVMFLLPSSRWLLKLPV